MIRVLILIALMLAPPEVRVNWIRGEQRDALHVSVDGDQSVLKECAKSGLEARVRYEMRLCHRRRFWWDDCGPERREVKAAQFDAINEAFKVVVDRFGDGSGPATTTAPTIEEALLAITSIKSVPMASLKSSAENGEAARDAYVSLRVLSECRGEYSQTLQRISYFVSLGILRTNGFDSGWIAFELGH